MSINLESPQLVTNSIQFWSLSVDDNYLYSRLKTKLDTRAPVAIVLVGPSGSGKTTWARELLAKGEISPSRYLNADTMRGLLGSGEGDQSVNKIVFDTLKATYRYLLKIEKAPIIVDNTSLDDASRFFWLEKAKEAGYATAIVYFDTAYEVCLNNIAARANKGGLNVPVNVVSRQFAKLQSPSIEEADIVICLTSTRGNQ
jgi:predicted kinase